MVAVHDLIERGIPDVIDVAGLDEVIAAEIDHLAGRTDRWRNHASPAIRARALVVEGDVGAARAALAEIDVAATAGTDLAATAWAIGRLGCRELADLALERLAAEPSMLFAGEVPLGPRAGFVGVLLAAKGDLDNAAETLADAVVDGDERAPLWGALARVELARVLRCRAIVGADATDDDSSAISSLEQAARLFFRAGGYRSLAERTDALLDPRHVSGAVGAPNVGWFVPGKRWRVGIGVMAPADVRPSKGLRALHHLIGHPGQPIPAALLDRVAAGDDPDRVRSQLVASAEDPSAGLAAALVDEPTRSRVQKLLRRSIDRLDVDHPLLGAHLRATVRTGQLCRYDPPSGSAPRWSMSG